MQARPLAALDLPLKVLVWDDDGQTRLAYTPPAELAARYDLDDELAGWLAGIDAVTDAVRVSARGRPARAFAAGALPAPLVTPPDSAMARALCCPSRGQERVRIGVRACLSHLPLAAGSCSIEPYSLQHVSVLRSSLQRFRADS
jgi:Domain of unknown function DUF302